MFDYAMFNHLLVSHLDDNSEKILYVCENNNVKKGFKRKHPEIERKYILTINEIWYFNKLHGLRYHDFVIV